MFYIFTDTEKKWNASGLWQILYIQCFKSESFSNNSGKLSVKLSEKIGIPIHLQTLVFTIYMFTISKQKEKNSAQCFSEYKKNNYKPITWLSAKPDFIARDSFSNIPFFIFHTIEWCSNGKKTHRDTNNTASIHFLKCNLSNT